jgi:dTDP-4-dehydrorhamnose 3,5-epimerase
VDIQIVKTKLDGVKLIETKFFQDHRGFFLESYHKECFNENGLNYTFVQDNHSRSIRNVLRGFHYQNMAAPQFRLVRCTLGHVWDVVVDLRVGSSTFGHWFGVSLTAENKRQVLIPPEFAHGFVVLSEYAEVQYKCTGYHAPSTERTLAWNYPDIGVLWPITNPILSHRDEYGMSLRDYLKTPDFMFDAHAAA